MNTTIDDLDRSIIRALQADSRRSNVEIARDLGVAEGTVRKRLDRLVQDKIVYLTAMPRMEAVGLSVEVMVLMQVEPACLDAVANQLASFGQVRSVIYVTGEHNLVLQAAFPDNDAVLHFLSTQVASLTGVTRTTTAHILQHVKAPHQWQLPLPSPPTVLIVDDDPDFVEVSRIVLEREGYVVLSASDGDAGLETLRKHHPDLVVLDVMMNSLLEGLNATWTIRADEDLRATPILMVSSIASSEYAEHFPTDEYVPVDNFLSKPIPPDKLLQEVRRLLSSHGGQRRPR